MTNLDLFPTITEVETYGSYQRVGPDVEARTVVTPDGRLTLFGDDSGGMLFDLAADPDELVNLFGRPGAARLERRFRDLMLTMIARQYHPLPQRNRRPLGRH